MKLLRRWCFELRTKCIRCDSILCLSIQIISVCMTVRLEHVGFASGAMGYATSRNLMAKTSCFFSPRAAPPKPPHISPIDMAGLWSTLGWFILFADTQLGFCNKWAFITTSVPGIIVAAAAASTGTGARSVFLLSSALRSVSWWMAAPTRNTQAPYVLHILPSWQILVPIFPSACRFRSRWQGGKKTSDLIKVEIFYVNVLGFRSCVLGFSPTQSSRFVCFVQHI